MFFQFLSFERIETIYLLTATGASNPSKKVFVYGSRMPGSRPRL
jgi:hypothetical protein